MPIAPILRAVVLVSLSACGGALGSENGTTGSETDAAPESGAQDAATDATADSAAAYAGLVRAMLRSRQPTAARALEVSFWPQPPSMSPAPSCANHSVTIGTCCSGITAIPLPVGPLMPLSAGDVTISLRGTPLATLLSPAYAEISDATWNGGDVLQVSAAGGNIAPFAGSLVTPTIISGVTPSFDATPVTIPRGTDFRVSWTPEKNGEQMLLLIEVNETVNAPDFIRCEVPDSAGSIVVDASLLGPIPSAAKGGIHLIRSITSSASGANVKMSLLGETWLDALATIP